MSDHNVVPEIEIPTENTEASSASIPTGYRLVKEDHLTDLRNQNIKRRRKILTVLLVLLILLLLGLFVLLAQFLPSKPLRLGQGTNSIGWVQSVYGYGTGEGQNMFPNSVAVSPRGDSFWVTDTDRMRLIEYYMNGSFKQVIDQMADGTAFNAPTDIAVASNGWLYVAQQTYNNVLVLDSNFKLQQTLNIEEPMSVAVNNNMVVVGGSGGFAAYRRDGSFIGVVGKQGHGSDNFDQVHGVVLDADNNVYVVDTYNNRLSKYDERGDCVWQVELGPSGNGGINSSHDMDKAELAKKWPAAMQVPQGVTLDAAGRVIVIDLLDYSVAAFNAQDGSFIRKWGEYGTADAQFSYPNDIAYNRGRDLFVTVEPTVGRAQIFMLDGSSSSPLAPLQRDWGDLLRICCIPLLIVLLLLFAYFIWRRRQRRKELLHNKTTLSGESQLMDSLDKGGEKNDREN